MSEANGQSAVPDDVLAGHGGAAHIVAENLFCTLGDRAVLQDVSLTVAATERVGLIGENGRGKSTLLRVLAKDLPVQRGTVLRAMAGHVGFLPQQPDFPPERTIAEVASEATADIDALATEMREAERKMSECAGDELDELLESYGRASEEFARRGGWELDARIGEVLEVFGLGGLEGNRTVATLSGGQRARLALAALVLTEPAGLLLDEPTNHLDDRAVDWLSNWLAEYQGPCLIASHDRSLLDTAVTAIVDLDGPRGSVVRYGGGYRDYLDERAAAQARWQQRYREWRGELAEARRRLATAERTGGHGKAMQDKNKLSYDGIGVGAQAAVARATRSARLRIRHLLDSEVPRPPEPLRFDPPETEELADQVAADGALLEASGITFGGVLHEVNLRLTPGSLHVITGGNGAGKSTLLSVLAGELAPDGGVLRSAPGLRIGHLPQETCFAGARRSLLAVYAEQRESHQEDAVTELRRFGLFDRVDFDVPVDRLSVGQRRRLGLAVMFAERPQLLLLDEPTNHLSLALVEQLQEAIEEFAGPVVLVSHDRTVRRRYRDHVLELTDGVLVPQHAGGPPKRRKVSC